MFELSEIEELFKSEDFAKSKAAIHAVLRNAALLHNKEATPEEKAIATENIKAITHGKQKKEPKLPAPVKALQQKKPKSEIPFPHDFHLHHKKADGSPITKEEFKGTWDSMTHGQRKTTAEFHQNHLASKVNKSVDTLRNLFLELKKHL
jgi:type IV secretory pathway VirB10-like protein